MYETIARIQQYSRNSRSPITVRGDPFVTGILVTGGAPPDEAIWRLPPKTLKKFAKEDPEFFDRYLKDQQARDVLEQKLVSRTLLQWEAANAEGDAAFQWYRLDEILRIPVIHVSRLSTGFCWWHGGKQHFRIKGFNTLEEAMQSASTAVEASGYQLEESFLRNRFTHSEVI